MKFHGFARKKTLAQDVPLYRFKAIKKIKRYVKYITEKYICQ